MDDEKIGEQVSSVGNAVKEGIASAAEMGSDLGGAGADGGSPGG
jgi:hypothetical protein